MQSPPADAGSRSASLALAAVLLLAAALRLWGLRHDLPFSYFGDELHFMKRAMALGTGDLNPHWFHKPAFLMYILAFVYGLYFVAGRITGQFGSTAEFGARFLFASGPFLLLGRLVVAACGVATVLVVDRIGRRVFGSPWAGVASALVAAVLTPMVVSSQTIKSDVPCGLLMALSVWAWLGTRESPRLRPLALASLLAGVAMGTHYYGVVLVPAYLGMEALSAVSKAVPWRTALRRGALVVLLFVAGFFLASPFNFLDPTWGRDTFGGVARTFGLGSQPAAAHYEPDSAQEFQPGAGAWGGAAVAFLHLVGSSEALGIALSLLAAAGLAATLARREIRWYGLLVLFPCLFFFLAAITVAAYHAQPRHLNALYPLLSTLAWPGALAAARLLRLPEPRVRTAALALVAAVCLPALARSVRYDQQINREDSRLVSYHWVLAELPADARILLDDYGPPLNPDARAAARLAARLRTLPPGPFTQHQGLRVELLQRFPPPDGRDLDELGHPWWLPREKTDEELRRDPRNLDMGNPLVSRQPRGLEEYRRQGIRYVVTNSEARDQYFNPDPRGSRFPSFLRFYRELDGTLRLRTFDPTAWGGKGPIVWIYDLAQPAPPGQRPLPEVMLGQPDTDEE
jgi:4-amino-4-deoxy-L-arabinose transferase-like glycosyltransferase